MTKRPDLPLNIKSSFNTINKDFHQSLKTIPKISSDFTEYNDFITIGNIHKLISDSNFLNDNNFKSVLSLGATEELTDNGKIVKIDNIFSYFLDKKYNSLIIDIEDNCSDIYKIGTVFCYSIDFILKNLENNNKIYLHCREGRNRSVFVLIGFIMFMDRYSFEEAYDIVSKDRDINVSIHMCMFLQNLDKIFSSNKCLYPTMMDFYVLEACKLKESIFKTPSSSPC